MICFHFTIFVVLETTGKKSFPYGRGCDLLSFYYLCRTGNNLIRFENIETGVVICFHFTIFVVLETTYQSVFTTRITLWFAFILLSLSYWKQPIRNWLACSVCCDLLSFYYLCRTGNNCIPTRSNTGLVVICFHFTIFVVLETTMRYKNPCPTVLWFAFILLSLSYWKQRARAD